MLLPKKSLSSALALSFLLIGACSDHSDQSETVASSTTSSAAKSDSANALPLTRENVNVTMELQGEPKVSSDGAAILVMVKFSNHGPVALSSAGKYPVNIGVHSVDASGNMINQDLVHSHFPETLAPGAAETVQVSMPSNGLIGHSAEILPLQEGVAWFDTFGTKPLMVGPFKTCDGADPSKVCDGSGQPLAAMEQ